MRTPDEKHAWRVYLLRASAVPLSGHAHSKPVDIDFYVRALSETEAGARAQDAFREKGWRFRDYLSLPAPLAEGDIRGDVKLRAGYEKAMSEDEVLIVSESSTREDDL